jgi:hypothetical protein
MTDKNKRTERFLVIGLLIWGLTVFALASFGFFSVIPRQTIAVLAVLGVIIPAIVYFRNKNFREYIASIGIKNLTIFHIWRIGAGFLFLFYGSQNLLPETFVNNAGYGDLAVGLLAFVLLLFPEGLAKYWVFHILGMLDFVIAVGTGLFFVLSGHSLMNNLVTLPVVLIPLFGVGISGATHIFAFDLLWKQRQENKLGEMVSV